MVSVIEDNREVGSEAATLQKVRNRLPIEITGLENVRG